MKRWLLLIGIVVGFTVGWLVAGPPAPHQAQAAPAGIANANPPPVGKTGAPSEGTCADCHGSGQDNSGGGLMAIVLAPGTYTPGQTYAIGVGVDGPGAARYGFELTALDASNMMAGTFTNLTDSTGSQSGGGRLYENQVTTPKDGTFAGSPDGGAWVFAWTAPPQGTGTVTFYAAGVAANNDNGADSGDQTYTATAISAESGGTPVQRTTWGAIKNRYR